MDQNIVEKTPESPKNLKYERYEKDEDNKEDKEDKEENFEIVEQEEMKDDLKEDIKDEKDEYVDMPPLIDDDQDVDDNKYDDEKEEKEEKEVYGYIATIDHQPEYYSENYDRILTQVNEKIQEMIVNYMHMGMIYVNENENNENNEKTYTLSYMDYNLVYQREKVLSIIRIYRVKKV